MSNPKKLFMASGDLVTVGISICLSIIIFKKTNLEKNEKKSFNYNNIMLNWRDNDKNTKGVVLEFEKWWVRWG